MNYHAEIIITEDIDNVYKCFSPEIESVPRAKVSIKKEPKRLLFSIDAKDSVALRAMLNGITRLLNVYEKVTENE